jgi:iron complex outermembrane receptor protein
MRIIICFLAGLAFGFSAKAQNMQGLVKGKLMTDDGKPAAFVTVYLKDTKMKVISKEDGTYEFDNIPDGNYVVIASFVGMQTQSESVSIQGGEVKVIDFKLKESAEELQEVIVSAGRSINDRTTSIGKFPLPVKGNSTKRSGYRRIRDA